MKILNFNPRFQTSYIKRENDVEVLSSETESEDETPTEQDMAFIDDNDANSSDTDSEWVCNLLSINLV